MSPANSPVGIIHPLTQLSLYFRSCNIVSFNLTSARKGTHIQRDDFARILSLITHNTHQALALLEQSGLQRNDDELHSWPGMLLHIVGYPADVDIVQRCIDFVKNEERRRLE